MTRNQEPETRNSEAGRSVRLRKPHPCGGAEFNVVREGPMVTLRCTNCGSFIRMTREKYEKAAARRQG
jgi:hypothetical protein